jgi:uncharacterized protein
MGVTFHPAKHQANLKNHQIDLSACGAVFDAPMLTTEDGRLHYGEQRLQTLGWLTNRVIFMVWIEREVPHIISCREATKHETKRYFKTI